MTMIKREPGSLNSWVRCVVINLLSIASCLHLLQKSQLQKHGSPPEEIMGPLPPGFSMGADGMPDMPDNCVIS